MKMAKIPSAQITTSMIDNDNHYEVTFNHDVAHGMGLWQALVLLNAVGNTKKRRTR